LEKSVFRGVHLEKLFGNFFFEKCCVFKEVSAKHVYFEKTQAYFFRCRANLFKKNKKKIKSVLLCLRKEDTFRKG